LHGLFRIRRAFAVDAEQGACAQVLRLGTVRVCRAFTFVFARLAAALIAQIIVGTVVAVITRFAREFGGHATDEGFTGVLHTWVVRVAIQHAAAAAGAGLAGVSGRTGVAVVTGLTAQIGVDAALAADAFIRCARIVVVAVER